MVDDEAELPLIGLPDRNPAARTCTRTLMFRDTLCECWSSTQRFPHRFVRVGERK